MTMWSKRLHHHHWVGFLPKKYVSLFIWGSEWVFTDSWELVKIVTVSWEMTHLLFQLTAMIWDLQKLLIAE